ncbi:MAG: lysozyme [Caulobacteraceae bacterium]|nr:lysozyme [Caulobacteraceae bacterium]
MKVSDAAKAMIKHHEGVRTRPYRCPALLWTVGVGHVIDPSHIAVKYEERRTLPIPDGWDRSLTMGEVDAILSQDLARFERGVARLCPAATSHQGQFDALVSFAFNVGLGNLQRSSIRMRYNRGDIEGAADAFLMWTKAAGKVLRGLVKRRNDERALFLSG